MQKRQNRDRIDAHFSPSSHHSSYSPASYRTSYQERGLDPEHRLRISEVRNATHQALGAGFEFTDESYDDMQRVAESGRGTTGTGTYKDDPIPQHYIDEFNKMMYEDDLENDRDQYTADCTPEAPWRAHWSMYNDIKPLARRETPPLQCVPSVQLERHDSAMEEDASEPRPLTRRPQLVSKFSWDSSVDEKPRKRRFWGFNRRR